MIGLNRVFLMGHLGSTPTERVNITGKRYTQLRLATQRPSKSGEEPSTADWHSIFVWGKQGENCKKYLDKGSPILVEGYISSYSKSVNGQTEFLSAINAVKVDFLQKSTDSEAMPKTES